MGTEEKLDQYCALSEKISPLYALFAHLAPVLTSDPTNIAGTIKCREQEMLPLTLTERSIVER